MFTAAIFNILLNPVHDSFTIAKARKQPKRPSTSEQTRKMRCTHNRTSLGHKESKIMPFAATKMVLEIITLSPERERQIPYLSTSLWNLKYDTNELTYETETDSQAQRRERDLWLPRRRVWGRDGLRA